MDSSTNVDECINCMDISGSKDDICPICLGEMKESCNDSLLWPSCNHRVHTLCALNAAQYDVRCPMCRTLDDKIKVRDSVEEGGEEDSDDSENFLETVERMIVEHERNMKNYKSKRYRLIRSDEKMRKLHAKVQESDRILKTYDRDLDREWNILQKSMWNTNKKICSLRNHRKGALRRSGYFNRRLDAEVEKRIGSPPEPPSINISS